MGSKANDMRGTPIYVGDIVSDGLGAGTVTEVYEDQVWFTVEGNIGKKIRGKLFNRPENLIVIPRDVWQRATK